MRVEFKE
jgi:hypothetical protein